MLERLVGVGVDRQAGTCGEHGVQAKRQAGCVDHLLDLGRYRLGHAHAAEGRVATHAYPAALSIGVVGFDEPGRRMHRAVVPAAAFLVGSAAERCNAACSDLACLLKHRHGRFGIDQLSQARQLRPLLAHVEDFIQYEAHVAQGRFIFSHDNLSLVRTGGDEHRSTGSGTSVTEQLLRHIGSSRD